MEDTNASVLNSTDMALNSTGKAVENLEDGKFDAEVKNFLAEKPVLAVILKNCVDEFQDCSLKDIAEKYIEGTPQVGIVGLDVDETNPIADYFEKIKGSVDAASAGTKIQGSSNEHTTKTEGKVFYDIRFLVQAPRNNGYIQMIINVEAQKNDTPGYPLTKRGFFYTGRMVSAQKGVEFTESHYEKVKNVYSIWICYETAKERQNTIYTYKTVEKRIEGDGPEHLLDPEDYQVHNVVLVFLGEPEEARKDGALRLLGTALSETIKLDQKLKVMSNDYEIPVTENIERLVGSMCNLSQGIAERNKKKGAMEMLFDLVKDGLLTLAVAAQRAGMDLTTFEKEYKTYCGK